MTTRIAFDLTVSLIALAVIGWLVWNWWDGRKGEVDDTDVGG